MHQEQKTIAPQRYADMDYNELTEILNVEQRKDPRDTKKIREIMRVMRSWLRNQEEVMKHEEDKEKQESEKQRRILKETSASLKETRKGYLEAYRIMNAFITSRSMITNVNEFKKGVDDFKKHSAKFSVALDAHIEKLEEARKEDSPLTIVTGAAVGT